jgi:hypothetical protein
MQLLFGGPDAVAAAWLPTRIGLRVTKMTTSRNVLLTRALGDDTDHQNLVHWLLVWLPANDHLGNVSEAQRCRCGRLDSRGST